MAESYVCKFNYKKEKNRDARTEIHKFERMKSGEKFYHYVDYVKEGDLSIYEETYENDEDLDKYIILGRKSKVYKIDKKRLKATEVWIYVNHNSEVVTGMCELEKIHSYEEVEFKRVRVKSLFKSNQWQWSKSTPTFVLIPHSAVVSEMYKKKSR